MRTGEFKAELTRLLDGMRAEAAAEDGRCQQARYRNDKASEQFSIGRVHGLRTAIDQLSSLERITP